MKTQMVVLTVLVLAVSLSFPVLGWSQAVQTAQDHLALAQTYQEKANLERQALAGYAREKANSGSILGIISNRSETPRVKEMDRDYDRLIAEKKAKVAEFHQLAQMHRLWAKELEKLEDQKKVENEVRILKDSYLKEIDAYRERLQRDVTEDLVFKQHLERTQKE